MSTGEKERSTPQEKEGAELIRFKVSLPKCVGSGDHTLELHSSLEDTISDLRQSLTVFPLTKNLTNYNIVLHGTVLSSRFVDLTPWEEVLEALGIEDKKEVKLVLKERAYNLAAVYAQINRFREIIGLNYLDRLSQDFGAQAGVENFNALNISPVKASNESSESATAEGKEEAEKKDVELTEEEKAGVLNIAEEIIESRPIVGEQAIQEDQFDKMKIPIKSIYLSQWSPVPAYRAQNGDLLYLVLQTLENDVYHITCHVTGFFVNKSSSTNFNPEIFVNEKGISKKSFILFDLVDRLSNLFGKAIEENDAKILGSSSHPEAYLLPTNSSLAHSWLVDSKKLKHSPDVLRSQLPLLLNGTDGSDLIRDWNEDIQSLKELPNNTINERILKEKLFNKTLSDFNKAATKTAVEIVLGNISPMNPNEPVDQHIFLKNNIFYSTCSNNTGAFEKTGGSQAARYTSNKDLAAIKILNRFDVNEIHILVTCIVDYMGKRVICQAPVPGIFGENPDGSDKVAYGLSTEGTEIFSNEEFTNGLKQISEVFHLKPHKVVLSESKETDKDLLISKDTKGIFGTDGRKYIIDLYRTTPLDINFIEEVTKDNSDESSYPHKEALLRHEAVEEWWKRKAAVVLKSETERLEKEGNLKAEDGEKPQIVIPYDEISLNPDSFTSFKDSEVDAQEVREVSSFVKEKLIEEFLDTVSSQIAPFDGQHLTSLLHKSGINMRYLGHIAAECIKRKQDAMKSVDLQIKANANVDDNSSSGNKESEDSSEISEGEKPTETKSSAKFEPIVATYNAIYKISVQEMVARASKHILGNLGEKIPTALFPHFVVHFHNCLFGYNISPNPITDFDESLRSLYTSGELQFTELNSERVLDLISKEVQCRFRYQLPDQWNENLVKPLQLMREIALKFGIQWKLLDYCFQAEDFENFKESLSYEVDQTHTKNGKKGKKKNQNVTALRRVERKNLFEVEDIVSFIPIVKDSSYRSSLVDDIFETAKININNDEKELGLSLLNELTSIYEQIYGILHPVTARFYTNLSQLYIDVGMTYEACTFARKAVILCERLTGLDSYETISSYINAAFFEVANEDYLSSFKLYQHAISKWKLVYGDDHPSFVTTFANLADMLINLKLNDKADTMLKTALDISLDVNGEYSELTGLLYYRLGITSLSANKLEESLRLFKEANKIFVSLLGKDDFFSTESAKYVSSVETYKQYLKNQASQQKTSQKKSSTVEKTKILSSKSKKTKSKKKSTVQPDPNIATRSVDDILKFIEG